jgi:hypothetical protein
MWHVEWQKEIHTRFLVGKLEVNIPLRIHRLSCDDNIKMGLKYVRCQIVDWIYLAQDKGQRLALVNTVMNIRVTLSVGNFFD